MMISIADHPDIRRMERWGHPEWQADELMPCECCGEGFDMLTDGFCKVCIEENTDFDLVREYAEDRDCETELITAFLGDRELRDSVFNIIAEWAGIYPKRAKNYLHHFIYDDEYDFVGYVKEQRA